MGEMKHLDALTKALHFEHAKEFVSNILKSAAAKQEMIVCATFDVDYLNEINEKYGWAAGDEVLRQLSAICHEEASIVTRNDDEMSVVWKDCSVEEGVKRATDLFKRIQSTVVEFEGVQIPVSVSMGITHNHEGEVECFSELVSTALVAMSKCKVGGRNRFIMDVAPYM